MWLDKKKRVYEVEENDGYTGKPDINPQSKDISRSINDLYRWDDYRQRKIEAKKESID